MSTISSIPEVDKFYEELRVWGTSCVKLPDLSERVDMTKDELWVLVRDEKGEDRKVEVSKLLKVMRETLVKRKKHRRKVMIGRLEAGKRYRLINKEGYFAYYTLNKALLEMYSIDGCYTLERVDEEGDGFIEDVVVLGTDEYEYFEEVEANDHTHTGGVVPATNTTTPMPEVKEPKNDTPHIKEVALSMLMSQVPQMTHDKIGKLLCDGWRGTTGDNLNYVGATEKSVYLSGKCSAIEALSDMWVVFGQKGVSLKFVDMIED